MHQQEPSNQSTGLVLGAIADFMTYLNQLEAPMVIGRDYKPDRIVDAFKDWATERSVSLKSIDRQLWLKACEQGHFSDKDT
jgi:hypothetical protein